MSKTGFLKIGIGTKVTALICAISLATAVIAIGLGYYLAHYLLYGALGEDRLEMAQNLAVSVSGLIDRSIENVSVHATNPTHWGAIKEKTGAYGNKDASAINAYLQGMDEKWPAAKEGSPLLDGYLQSASGQRLRKYTVTDRVIAEIFTTDKYGGVAAASNKTSDFYQADEEWWQKAYNNGKGGVYVGKVEYDESAGSIAMPVAVPVKDGQGEVIGVLKAVLDAGVLFEPLEDFQIGRTGHAVLAGEGGLIIFHPGLKPMSVRVAGEEEYRRLLKSQRKWEILKSPHAHRKDMFLAFAPVKNPYLVKNGLAWSVFVDQDAGEVFLPVHRLMRRLSAAAIILVVILMPAGYFLGGIFVRPVQKLREAVEHIGKGELDYPIAVRTGDEVEDLAKSFKAMMTDLSRTTTSIERLDKEAAERKKAEEKLRESEGRLRCMLQSIGDHMSMMDKDLNILWANEVAKKIFGEDIIGKKCYAVYHGINEPCRPYPCITLKSFQDGKIHEHETQVKDKDGRDIYFHCTANVALRDEEGRPQAVLEVSRDVTQARKAQEEIEAGKARVEQILEGMVDGVTIVDMSGKIISVNKAALAQHGYKTEEEVAGKAPSDVFIGKSDLAKFQEVVKKLNAGEEVKEQEFLDRRRDGTTFPVSVNLSLLKDRTGRPAGIIAVHRDITDRKKAEEAVLESVRLKEGFLSTVSHELRTPLTAIKEGIGIVWDGSAGDISKEQKDFLDMARKNVDRLARLINDVLDFSKLKAGKMGFKMSKGDVKKVIEDAVKSQLPIAKEKGLYLKMDAASDMPEAMFDPDRITQVIVNLISNAIKFTDKGGVTVSAGVEGGDICVCVADTGRGIRPDDLPKLFQEFRQLADQKVSGGTGLGLAISSNVIGQHRGRLWAESEYGKGARFRFTMPIERRYKVLVIDDDREFLKFCGQLLKAKKYDVITAETGGGGIEKAGRDRPDLIVVDMKLPDISGYEVIGRLKTEKHSSAIPVLAVSGYVEELDKLSGLKIAGDTATVPKIAKPFDVDEFLRTVRFLLGQEEEA